ncbi:MAG: WG repeat-containing protein [Porphyromonadaceae bacterium]|nr:WG repeat-containing protein [Porphyromonadaceae bacterium]
MSDEKKMHHGRVKFYKDGYVGIKDFDGNVIIPTDLRYTEIVERENEEVVLIRRESKWALAGQDGQLRCPFVYDNIVYIGDHCYKAGVYVKPDNGEIIVAYMDTRMTYDILDGNGQVLCPREKGYNYISEIHEGEVTAAINGKCGVVDIHGNVVIDFLYKYIQPMGEGHYLVSYGNQDDYYATIIDSMGHVLIPASMQYRDIYNFHNGIAIAFQNEKWGLIDGSGQHVCSFEYNYIKEWGEGYYKVEKGAKKNILRPDGSLVLQEWFNHVTEVTQGFFQFGNTIRKSKTNPQTRYVWGLAHVNGDVIFPMIFNRLRWNGNRKALYAEIGTKPYIITLDGGIYDPQQKHFPLKLDIDEKSFFENLANWVLPGLQFFYRDTNAITDAANIYHVGDTVRAGFFVDATTKLLKPAHHTRFIIASAHAARFYELGEQVKDNPDIAKWNLVTFHFNSYFKVMDVYVTPLCTQVFLLHIPMSAAILLKESMAFKFLNEVSGQEMSLVQMARKSLDEKMRMGFHDRSFDVAWCKRMERPIGVCDDLTLFPLNPDPEPSDKDAAILSNLVHSLAKDADIDYKTEVNDNFPWEGVERSVCQGCIYAHTITGKGEGCAKLHKDAFRENYVKGICPHRKTSEDKESDFEFMERRKAEKAKEKAEKTSNIYALQLVKDFIADKLDGDLDKLREYDLLSLHDDEKYGSNDISRVNIVKAVMALVFSDAWPDLNVYNIDQYLYRCSEMNHYLRLFGMNILDRYFKSMQKFHPTEEQHQRAVKVAHLIYTIGNIWVLPNKVIIDEYKNSSRYHGYMDKFLQGMYAVFTGQENRDKELQQICYSNRKFMAGYQGEEGFHKFIRNMMLEDYVDEYGMPKDLFMSVWNTMKGLSRDDYFKAVDVFCSFCEEAIPKRTGYMIEKLKMLINK